LFWISLGFCVSISFATDFVAEAPSEKRLIPLPLEVAATLPAHNGRSPVNLSPDGQWVARTEGTKTKIPRATSRYSATGFPFAEGDSRMRITLTSTRTGETVVLGDPESSNWGAVWSPDGRRVAFYSDAGGEAGIWIWEKASGRVRRFPAVIARPFFGFETVRWTPDGERILCKILPEGMTIAQANSLQPDPESPQRFPPVGPSEPSVFVLKSDPAKKPDDASGTPPLRSDDGFNFMVADLAILDLRDDAVVRIAKNSKPAGYAFAPDGKTVAYTVFRGIVPNAQQGLYDLIACDLATGETRTLAGRIRLGYGIEWNWSPDGRFLAYIATGLSAKGEIVVISVPQGVQTVLHEKGFLINRYGHVQPPLWDSCGKTIYAVGEGQLWGVDVATGKGTRMKTVPGEKIVGIVARSEAPTIWSPDRGRSVWVLGQEIDGLKMTIRRIDVASGTSHLVHDKSMSCLSVFNLDASDETGDIIYVASDQQHLNDIWIFNVRSRRGHQVTHLSEDLERYELGHARTLEWRASDGKLLRGALLLPPDYRTGIRIPMVVWVYGGEKGSNFLNRFGFWGEIPEFNMHVLATRGYGVLFPDAPVNTGTELDDLMDAVIPGVKAAVDEGYADPERLAVMGQSYGAYCVLGLISRTTLFKAAVITASVIHPDLISAYLEMGLDGSGMNVGYYEQGQGNMGGTPWEYRDRYLDNSPIFRFDHINTPLLIGQGEKDGRLLASDAVFVALKRLGKDVEYRIYESESHAISKPANVIDFWQRRLSFLAEHLHLMLDSRGKVISDMGPARSR
jgi:dipeptidyl aminopeptidase/acylaminoacyl peptidase